MQPFFANVFVLRPSHHQVELAADVGELEDAVARGACDLLVVSHELDGHPSLQLTSRRCDREASGRGLGQEPEAFDIVRGRELPAWAADFDCASWAQFSLKFILSHPAVTCVLTETANPRHAADNLGAGFGRLPDEPTR
mgnify:CR=1 FL=1